MVDWSLAGGGGFQNALATGLQLGGQIRKSQDERATRSALGTLLAPAGQVGVDPQAQTNAFGVLAKVSPELAFKVRGYQADQAAAETKAAEAKRKAAADALPTQIQMLESATPENWQGLRSEAIRLGVGSEQGLPAQFTPEFRDSQLKILKAFKQNPDLMTTEVKTVLAGLPPDQRDLSNPAAYQAVARAAEKIVPLENGGSALGYNPSTGQSRTIVAQNPGGFAPGAPAPQGNLPRITSPDQAKQLPPGSQFMLPDGRIGTVPGGPAFAPGGFSVPSGNPLAPPQW